MISVTYRAEYLADREQNDYDLHLIDTHSTTFTATGYYLTAFNIPIYNNKSNMKIYNYWSERGTRPKPKLVTKDKIKEIRADFF